MQKTEYDAGEMAQLYLAKPNEWLLLEILETDESGRAKRLRLLKSTNNKEELYDYLMDEIEDWDWGQNFIIVFSEPEKECDI